MSKTNSDFGICSEIFALFPNWIWLYISVVCTELFGCNILVLSKHKRIDRGTETDIMATMQMYLCDKHNVLENANESVWYGPSTQNKIKGWWRERFFKQQLSSLAEKDIITVLCCRQVL